MSTCNSANLAFITVCFMDYENDANIKQTILGISSRC